MTGGCDLRNPNSWRVVTLLNYSCCVYCQSIKHWTGFNRNEWNQIMQHTFDGKADGPRSVSDEGHVRDGRTTQVRLYRWAALSRFMAEWKIALLTRPAAQSINRLCGATPHWRSDSTSAKPIAACVIKVHQTPKTVIFYAWMKTQLRYVCLTCKTRLIQP